MGRGFRPARRCALPGWVPSAWKFVLPPFGAIPKSRTPAGANGALAAACLALSVPQGWVLPALLRQFRGPIPLPAPQEPGR